MIIMHKRRRERLLKISYIAAIAIDEDLGNEKRRDLDDIMDGVRLETQTKILKRVGRKLGRKSQKKIRRHMGLGGRRETKKLEMRLGRDGVWWEKGNTEN